MNPASGAIGTGAGLGSGELDADGIVGIGVLGMVFMAFGIPGVLGIAIIGSSSGLRAESQSMGDLS